MGLKIKSDSADVEAQIDEVEQEIRLVIREAGLDDKIWVQKLQERLNLDNLKSLTTVTREQFDVFLKSCEIQKIS